MRYDGNIVSFIGFDGLYGATVTVVEHLAAARRIRGTHSRANDDHVKNVCTWWPDNGAGMGRGPALLVLSECCAYVIQHDFYSSYSQGNDERVQMVPRPKPLSVR